MVSIHPTAIVASGSTIDDEANIGPYCVIGEHVTIGARCHLVSHVVVAGQTTIGDDTVVYPFASLGQRPQDLKYHGENSRLMIGARNQIREQVTMNPGTEGGGMATVVGDDNLFMVGAHVAHDCHVGSHVVMANNATLAGHVTVEDYAIVGGLSAVHQFVRIGRHAIIGGMSGVENDVIPYGSVKGERAALNGLNLVGLRRRGFDRDSIDRLRQAYRTLFGSEGTLQDRIDRIAVEFAGDEAVQHIIAFLRSDASRAVLQPKSGDDD
ncbi:MAG: acyl-ACP--UDP-N-acetylglucosamine O-acyltransferase [Alphaproteobacteria bacterium]